MAETRTTSSTGGQKGVKLARFDLIPAGPLKALAEHYGRGAAKYANHQWRQGYEWSKSYAAMCRHQNAFWAGEDYDVCPEDNEGCAFETAEGEPFEPFFTEHGRGCYNHTTSHHLAAVAWHAFCLLEFVVIHPEHDDRYRPDGPDPDFAAIADKILGERNFVLREDPTPGATRIDTETDDNPPIRQTLYVEAEDLSTM